MTAESAGNRIHWDDDICPHCSAVSPHLRDDKEEHSKRTHRSRPSPYRSRIFCLIFPRYQRLSIFMMAVSAILVGFTASELHGIAARLFIEGDVHLPVSALLLFTIGLIYSLFYGFTTGPLTIEARRAMLFFAISANILAGIAAGVEAVRNTTGIMLFFPIWNLANSALLLVLFWSSADNQNLYRDGLVDRRANRFVIGAGYGIALATFFVCHKILNLHWSYTFSICIACATNFGGIIDLITSRRSARNHA